MIRIEHLRKEFPNATPLKDINAEISTGEVISVIGPSGTGKSTLLRCLNMLDPPTSGRIIIDGEDITEKDYPLHLVRRKMGMVFQSFNLFQHMNVLENITYAPRKLMGLSKQDAETKALEYLRLVGLLDKKYAYPDELSGGQQQRAAIARTLAMEPEIILFDEPTSALDPTRVGEVLGVIRMLARRGMTMMIVTHEMRFARDVSTRIFYMDQGLIYEDGTPEQIFDNPQKELTRRFVQKMKVLEKEISADTFDFPGFSAELELFGRSHEIPQVTINAAQVILEELCLQTMLYGENRTENINFTLEYGDTGCKAILIYGGDAWNPMDSMDMLSRVLVENASEKIDWEHDGEQNRLSILLRAKK